MDKIKAVFNWSGGKDSAHALLKAMESDKYDIIALLTTVNSQSRRSTMHDIPVHVLERQAQSIGIPLYVVNLKPKENADDYSAAMEQAARHFKDLGVTHFIFGDIFLHDVRAYREQHLSPLGIEIVEPLWDKSSTEVMEDFLKSGLKATIVTTMADGLGRDAIGKQLTSEFIKSLPADCDPNGENGEYHTICHDGPIFAQPVQFTLGKPFAESHDIKLDDGSIKTFTYWFANIK